MVSNMSINQDLSVVGIVIPTLGNRDRFLKQSINSIRTSASAVHICLVAPKAFLEIESVKSLGVDQLVIDDGEGLAAAINKGLKNLPQNITHFNWLGDDDLLRPNSMNRALEILQSHPDIAFVYGSCEYIDEHERVLFINKSGKWAKDLMRFGPQLVPQPGALIQRKAFERIGGLDSKYKWAFDLDMFIRLSEIGRSFYLDEVVAAFRWHGDSLSVGGRKGSVKEASSIRLRHTPKWLLPVATIWEPLCRLAIFYSGQYVTRQSARKK